MTTMVETRSCGKIRRFVAGMTFEPFVADERTCNAVIRNIEAIGEIPARIREDGLRDAHLRNTIDRVS